jgi:hypothetical protein
VSARRLLLIGLVAALLVAGVASYYASSHPDGLEHVAEQAGFLDTARDSAAADSPLADYQTDGIDDARLSGGVAGVVGALVVLLLAGGLAWALRRRGPRTRDPAEKQDA